MFEIRTYDRIIEILEQNRGKYISGQKLAEMCNVSRNAIWKTIVRLKNEGFELKGIKNRGYMFEPYCDVISARGIWYYMKKKYTGIENSSDDLISDDELLKIYNPKMLNIYTEIDSTNNEAKRNLFFTTNAMLHGMVFAAKTQLAGRGHGKTKFLSPDGGVYMSIILEPDKLKDRVEKITKVIENSVVSVLKRFYDVKLHTESNSSIYVGKEKICGIMTEGISDMETGEYSSYIAGIGIRTDILSKLTKTKVFREDLIANIILELL